jgi:transposase
MEGNSNLAPLSDTEWPRVEAVLPRPRVGGRPRGVCLRAVCDAILYVLDTGCRWRDLPEGFAPWYTAYWYYRAWQQDGTLARILSSLDRPVPSECRRPGRAGSAVLAVR